MSANAIETLREECERVSSILTYEPTNVQMEEAVNLLLDVAVRLAAVEALLEAAKDACERNPAHLLNLRVAIRRVETGQ